MTGHAYSVLDDSRLRSVLDCSLARATVPAFHVVEARIGTPLQLKRIEYTRLCRNKPTGKNRPMVPLHVQRRVRRCGA